MPITAAALTAGLIVFPAHATPVISPAANDLFQAASAATGPITDPQSRARAYAGSGCGHRAGSRPLLRRSAQNAEWAWETRVKKPNRNT